MPLTEFARGFVTSATRGSAGLGGWHRTQAGSGETTAEPSAALPSPAGPYDGGLGVPPPQLGMSKLMSAVAFSVRQGDMMFRARRKHGDVFQFNSMITDLPTVVTCHPDHIKSLLTADPAIAPSLAKDSPLRPIVGESSVLTAVGERHRRQRKLLMPSFHGEAIARYRDQIVAATDRNISGWSVGSTFPLAIAAQAITLDVIMAGVFGIDGRPRPDSPEHRLRRAVRSILWLSTSPLSKPAELMNLGRDEAVGVQRVAMARLDRAMYAVIGHRREDRGAGDQRDVLSLLLGARADDGEALTDLELRNELLTLVLAGHETTANSIAWACERLLRNRGAYDSLREAVRDGSSDYLDATIYEAMRARPVVPIIGRQVEVPWQLGEFVIPAGTHVLVSILLLHHREDIYPDPHAFRPERFLGVKPGTPNWLPFGGGDRRCLGSALALEEMRIVLREIVRRTDLRAPDLTPERPRHRNVTMIPARGGRVTLEALRR